MPGVVVWWRLSLWIENGQGSNFQEVSNYIRIKKRTEVTSALVMDYFED